MKPFEYASPTTVEAAVGQLGPEVTDAKVLAGGVDLLGEMKGHVIAPRRLVSLGRIPGLTEIAWDSGGLRLGAMVTLTDVAEHPQIRRRFAAIAQAAESVGSPQIRNVGTVGGNLCQRPRCWYYRDEFTHCLKKGGDRCYTVDGENKYHAIFGSGPCHIVHPSDLAPALIAFDARVSIQGPESGREISLADFFATPTVNVFAENILAPNEIITSVRVSAPTPGTRSVYVKFRERESFDFALVSVASVLIPESGAAGLRTGRCRDARIVLGGVAPVPWRSRKAEDVLRGERIDEVLAARAGEAAIAQSAPMSQNGYKVLLTRVLVRRAILTVL